LPTASSTARICSAPAFDLATEPEHAGLRQRSGMSHEGRVSDC